MRGCAAGGDQVASALLQLRAQLARQRPTRSAQSAAQQVSTHARHQAHARVQHAARRRRHTPLAALLGQAGLCRSERAHHHRGEQQQRRLARRPRPQQAAHIREQRPRRVRSLSDSGRGVARLRHAHPLALRAHRPQAVRVRPGGRVQAHRQARLAHRREGLHAHHTPHRQVLLVASDRQRHRQGQGARARQVAAPQLLQLHIGQHEYEQQQQQREQIIIIISSSS